jgi:hypothetical protein
MRRVRVAARVGGCCHSGDKLLRSGRMGSALLGSWSWVRYGSVGFRFVRPLTATGPIRVVCAVH